MRLRWSAKGRSAALAAGLLLAGAFLWWSWRWPVSPAVNTGDAVNRQHYAALYQAAWRQDDGQSPMLVTATLLVPPTVQVLGQDTGRSSTEEQIWNTVNNLSATEVPIVLTIDSVTGTVTDEAIQDSLSLSSDGGPSFRLSSWSPLIAPSRIVNTNGSTSSQIGLAVFTADRVVDWNKLQILKLNVNGLVGEPQRVFTWTEPRLLLQI